MTMFDNIHCEYPLPGAPEKIQNGDFQTKGFECLMDRYTITKEGQLIFHRIRHEIVPEEKRPFYGTPQWEHPLGQLCGMLKTIPVADEDMKYHGVVRMYTMASNKEWFVYEIEFIDGKVENIKRIYKEFGGE